MSRSGDESVDGEVVSKHLREPVFVVDADGALAFANERFLRVTRLPRDRVVGADVSLVEGFVAQGAARFRDAVDAVVAGESDGERVELSMRYAESASVPTRLPVEARVTPLAEGEMRGALVVLRDVGHRRERVRRLNREVRRFEAVFDSPDSLIGVLDPDGTLVEVNQTALSFADVDPEDVVGRPFWETPWWAHSTSLQSELRAWVDRAASGEHVRFESTHVSAAGEEVTVDGVIRPVTDGDEVVSLIVESRDVTEQQEYARELERKNEHLDKFASIVSHDLRNPLNVARGSLELAREECDSEHLDRIGRAHHRMEALIEDLLTLAREGTAVTEFESVDLAAAMERCWQNVETAAADLRVDVDCAIRADRSRFQQLAENLMRNAIQHGGPDVTVTVGRLDDGDGFFVADDGPGIPAAERDRVFEFGYSADGAGTGFGLDIVTAVAAAHGWDVEATESADGGARFEIRGVDCE